MANHDDFTHDIFLKHEKRFGSESEKVKAWRFALNRVCALSGLHYKDDSYESGFIDKIVRDISAKLPPMPLQIKHLVGLDSRFEQVKSLIDIVSDDSVSMLGIYGGKSIEEWDIELQKYKKVPDVEIQEMHDLIQDMGREIVRKESISNPGERSRLWSHKDVLAVLKGNVGSSTVEGIKLHPPKQEKVDNPSRFLRI
ncbi:hypothetical protein P8452_30381 [Trifolium repens]|nr:hypothetical protein P8452_30381 [Trifolium repens]